MQEMNNNDKQLFGVHCSFYGPAVRCFDYDNEPYEICRSTSSLRIFQTSSCPVELVVLTVEALQEFVHEG